MAPSVAINSRRPTMTGNRPSPCGGCLPKGPYHAKRTRCSHSGGRGGRCCAATAMTVQGQNRISSLRVPSGMRLEFGLARSPGNTKVSFQAARSIG
jgi:hypothetical protein